MTFFNVEIVNFFFQNITKDGLTELENWKNGNFDSLKLPKSIKSMFFDDKISCTCQDFAKKFVCVHSVVSDVILKRKEIPNNAKTVTLKPNKKRGRVSKAKKALEKQ